VVEGQAIPLGEDRDLGGGCQHPQNGGERVETSAVAGDMHDRPAWRSIVRRREIEKGHRQGTDRNEGRVLRR